MSLCDGWRLGPEFLRRRGGHSQGVINMAVRMKQRRGLLTEPSPPQARPSRRRCDPGLRHSLTEEHGPVEDSMTVGGVALLDSPASLDVPLLRSPRRSSADEVSTPVHTASPRTPKQWHASTSMVAEDVAVRMKKRRGLLTEPSPQQARPSRRRLGGRAGVALDEAPGFRETLQPRPPDLRLCLSHAPGAGATVTESSTWPRE